MADYITKGSFNLGNQITLKNKNSNIDRDYGPYENKTLEEIAEELKDTLQIGKTIGVIESGKVVEYWWQPVDGGYEFVKKGAVEIVVDSELNTTSTNPIQNQAVANALVGKADSSTVRGIDTRVGTLETTITSKAEQSTVEALQTVVGENTTAIAGKQDKITVETIQGDILGEIYFVLKANIIYDIYALCTNNTTVVEIEFEGNPNESGQHYMMRLHFQDDATNINVTMYSAITWYGGNEPEWQAGKTYEISILDGLAMYAEFDTPTTE